MLKKVIFLLLILIFIIYPFIYVKNVNSVDVTHISHKYYQNILEVNGIIEADESTKMSLSYPVFIKETYINENEYVNKGQLLFSIDKDLMEEYVKNSKTSYSTETIPFNSNVIYEIPYNIYASDSGIVQNISAKEGELLLSNEVLCEINQSDNYLAKISLSQEEYAKVSVGDYVELNIDIAPNINYYGYISNKTAKLRKEKTLSGTKTVLDVYVNLLNPDNYIISGLQFSGKIYNGKPLQISTLPYEFINQDKNGEFVYIFENGNILKQYVITGIEGDNYIEILTDFNQDTIFLKNDYNNQNKILIKYDYK